MIENSNGYLNLTSQILFKLMKIHFIGICGKLNAGLAISLRQQGNIVTGSDKAFYPPMSEVLNNAGLPIMVGYKPNHIIDNNPDLVAYGAAISEDNPEVICAKKLNIQTISPTELIEKFVIKKESIVISGNYGKTTITALLVKIFKSLGLNPSYLIGGEVKGLNSVEITDSDWSIVEGDEYPAVKNGKSKFFFYHPKFLVITNIAWDHTDIFQSPDDYALNFVNLVTGMDSGHVIINGNDKSFQDSRIFDNFTNNRRDNNNLEYAKLNDYLVNNRLEFHGEKIEPKIWGSHNLINISICLKLLETCFDIKYIKENLRKIVEAINDFEGVSRRNQLIYKQGNFDIIDDFAHNPAKFSASIISNLENLEGEGSLIIILEPNLGNRTKYSLEQYKNIFDSSRVKKIIIPKWRVSNLKEDSIYVSGQDFAKKINELYSFDKATCIENDDELVELIYSLHLNYSNQKLRVLIMSSEPFRGITSKLIQKLERN